MFTALGTLWQHALALVLPPTCISCHSQLSATEPMGFCPTCYGHLPWWNPAQVLPPPLPPALSSFAAPCLYADPLRQVLRNLKFHDAPHTAPILAQLLLPLVPPQITLVLPVPSHFHRLHQRRYNHAALLAWAVAKRLKLSHHPTWLKRLQPGPAQHASTRAQRLRLPSTHFWANPKVRNAHVLLIDDIRTTGATLRACALALKKAGAASVHARTLAYTAPNQDNANSYMTNVF